MWLGKNPLPNLTIIIDRNYIQIDGITEDVMPLEPLKQKLEAFGLHVLEVDGHNIRAFVDKVREAQSEWRRTSVIIAYTIPGKGVSFMEKKFEWHGKPPNKEEAKKALEELRTLGGKITSEHQ
jgi:transketolase